MTLKREIYQSTTGKAIPLSFTGRHLLQSLREAIVFALSKNDYHADNDAVSKARCKLAEYMSRLEYETYLEKNFLKPDLSKVPNDALVLELISRMRMKPESLVSAKVGDSVRDCGQAQAQPQSQVERCSYIYQDSGLQCQFQANHPGMHNIG
jgi:hypothetical protein